jgi:hypothetical protein
MAKRSSRDASSETSKVKAVNLAYYKALSASDLGAMDTVWTCTAKNILIAPPVKELTQLQTEFVNAQIPAFAEQAKALGQTVVKDAVRPAA